MQISVAVEVMQTFIPLLDTVQKMKFSFKTFFNKCDQIRVSFKFGQFY